MAVTVPAAVKFSLTLRVPLDVKTGALSLTAVMLIVTCAVSVRAVPGPPSLTYTVNTTDAACSRSRFVLSATVIAPVVELIAKLPSVLPPVIE